MDDDDESITLSFDDNHIRPGGTNETATITLTDNDDPQVEVEFGASSLHRRRGRDAIVHR